MSNTSGKIILAGGSGFIGQALTAAFLSAGYSVVVLSRQPGSVSGNRTLVQWDGRTSGAWEQALNGASALINLSGRSVNCPHTANNLLEIRDSRTGSVQALAAAMARVSEPPQVWIQASAIGFYGDTGDRLNSETSPPGADSLASVCQDWEGAFNAVQLPATRRVILRLGFVLGRNGGALPILMRMTRCFLGGAAGSGRQYVSWIHLADVVEAFAQAVQQPVFSGTYNVVAPEPATNRDFMRVLRQVLHRPWSPPAPALAVRWGARLMGSEGSLALVSQRCSAQKLLDAGFSFQFPRLDLALEDLCRSI